MSALKQVTDHARHTTNGRSMLEAALEHYDQGRSVFPVRVEKDESGKWTKTPLVKWKPLQTERVTREATAAWWRQYPDASIGCALGLVSGIDRMDEEGPVPKEFLGKLTPTKEFKSISGGKGYIYECCNHESTGSECLWKGGHHEEFRYQTKGCYTVLPPSPGYEWTNDLPVAPFPSCLKYELLNRAAGKELARLRREQTRTTPSGVKRADVLEALDRLSMERCDDRDRWKNVVFALYSGGGEYYDAATEWSQKSAKYNIYDVDNLWDWCENGAKDPLPPLKAIIEWAKVDSPGWNPSSGYKCRPIDLKTFLAGNYTMEWAVQSILVMGQPAIIGGPKKSCKTSVAIDLGISLASGISFLGQFKVYKKRRVLIISGESGEAVIQETFRRVMAARSIDSNGVELFLDFTLPHVSSPADMLELASNIKTLGAEVVIIDPMYTCLTAGNGKVNAANLFDMGPLLSELGQTCLDAGATPVCLFHARKSIPTGMGPIELEHLAFSGTQEWARQWLLLNPRARFDTETGTHRLHFSIGGSAGQSGSWHLDIEEGRLGEDFGGRKWGVKLEKVSAVIKEKEKAAGKKLQEDREAVCRVLLLEKECSKASLKDKSGLTPARLKKAIDSLVADGKVAEVELSVIAGHGHKPAAGVVLLERVEVVPSVVS